MSISTLAPPLKRAEHLDWVKPLTKFIEKEYSKLECDAHKGAIEQFQQLRTDVEKATERSTATRELLMRYFEQASIVASRFPINETSLKCLFVWRDAFSTSKMGQYYAPYELSSLLYSIGACCAALGRQEALKSNGEGLKKAAHEFQVSAGVFKLIKDEYGPQLLQGSTPDLSNDFLDAMERLMLAQAQECFTSRAVSDKKSTSIISLIAGQTSLYYTSVMAIIDSCKAVSGGMGKEWVGHIRVKSLTYSAIAHYNAALTALSNDQYGVQVGRLTVAMKMLDEAKYHVKQCKELLPMIDGQYSIVSSALKGAVKDNDTVYHEPVPYEKELELGCRAMVSATPYSHPHGPALVSTPSDPFSGLAPLSVHTALSEYTARRDGVVNSIERELRDETTLCDSTLASLGLPASLEALDTARGIPAGLHSKVAAARSETGGFDHLQLLMGTLRSKGAESAKKLEHSIQTLAQEASDDEEMRGRFGNRWRILPSLDLTEPMRMELDRYSGHLRNAMRSDQVLEDRLRQKEQQWRMIDLTPSELDALIPVVNGSGVTDVNNVSALKSTLTKLAHMKDSRSGMLSDLHAAVMVDNVMGVLMKSNLDSEKETVFNRELGKFDPFRKRLQDSISEQRTLLDRVAAQNTVFERSMAQDEGSRRRIEVLQELELAVTTCVAFLKNVGEGVRFYDDFDDRISTVQHKCDDFVVARRMQRQDVLAELTGSQIAPTPQTTTPTPQTTTLVIRCYSCSQTLRAPAGSTLVMCPTCKSVNQIK